uniref:Uncharacterized protein n=1 Tax=Rhodnius prolixus TaxID=13249 RepID=T1HM47_RHOPR
MDRSLFKMKMPSQIKSDDNFDYNEPVSPTNLEQPTDFSEYMWMENEEEFDKQ